MNKATTSKIPIRILVIDDEEEITDLLVRHFSYKGYDIIGVNEPQKALKMIEEENFSIVITDIVMPGMDGLEILKKIKAYNGAIQVIMTTGYVTIHNILTAMRWGAETVFFKPLTDLDRMENAIRQCVGRINMWQDILKELTSLGKAEPKYV